MTVSEAPYSEFERDASKFVTFLPNIPPAVPFKFLLFSAEENAPTDPSKTDTIFIDPVMSGIPGVLYFPGVPPFRKD